MGKLTSKTKKMIAATTAFAMLAGVFSFGLTYNWFIEDNRTEVDMNGVVHGSYFESGSGTYEDPFEIARPVQLYYLSWLQEMGYFNQPEMDADGHEIVNADGTISIRQFSFYLSEDLDMSEYTLPPIGTQTFPFVGEFNGRNHKIYNLTVDNDKSALTDDPSTEAYNFQIIGLFGVIGSLDGQNANTVNGLPPEGENAGIATPGYTYDTSALSVKNFQIENTTIKTSTSNSLIGVAAGYVNGPLSNVGVNTSTIKVGSGVSHLDGSLTSNISNYSIIGYCTDKYKEKLHIVDTTVYDATGKSSTFVTNSQGNAWGGSIDMKTMVSRVMKSKNLAGTKTNEIPSYPVKETAIKDSAGNVTYRHVDATSTQPGNYYNNAQPNTGGNEPRDNYYKQDDDIGSYYFTDMTTNDGQKAYLQGYTDVESGGSKTVDYFTYTDEIGDAYYLNVDGEYLTVSSNGAISYVSSTSESVKWHFDESDHYLNCLAIINDVPMIIYLNANSDGNLFLANSGQTQWTNDSGSFTVTYYSGSDDETHYWYDSTTSGKVHIENCSNCSKHAYRLDVTEAQGHNNPRQKMEKNNPSTWTINGAIPAGTYEIYMSASTTSGGHGSQTLYEGNNVYKYLFRVNNGADIVPNTTKTYEQLGYTISKDGSTTAYADMEATVNITSSSTTFSLVYNGTGYRLYIDHVRLVPLGGGSEPITITLNKTNTTDNKFVKETKTERSGQAGYIPLTVNGDATTFRSGNPTIDDYQVSDKNTGYVVGGFYDKNNGQNREDTGYRGDVRIAEYKISKISNAFENNRFKNLYTIKNGQKTAISLDTYRNSSNPTALEYKKLSNSLTELERNLKDSTGVYGIHFMSSVISTDHLITAPKVVLNKTTYENFELPEDSVDFTLKDKGYINFFAGEWQAQTNSFFDLSKIERDPNDFSKITTIKKISAVYSTEDISKPYIYKYSDGTYSEAVTNVSGDTFTAVVLGDSCQYSVCFKTSDIGKSDAITGGGKDVFYFEIPVNSGEYALGSVQGATGGYLIYLDISAASQTIHRQTISETFISVEEVYEHPLGVGYYDGDLDGTNPGSVDDRDSVAISLDDDATGDYSVSRTGNTINTGSNSTGAEMGFRGDGLTTSPLSPNGKSTTITRRRMTDYDFNDITGVYVKQVTNVETIGNHSKVSIDFSYNEITPSNNDDYEHILSFSFEFDGTTPFYAYKYYYHESDQVVELIFQTSDEFDITLDYLASGYGVTTDAGTQITRTISSDPENPTVLSVDETAAFIADVWDAAGEGSFRFHYQYSDVDTVETNIEYTFDSLNEPAGSGTGENQEKTITIVNGIYTITVTVTSGNENITVYTYNLGNNIVVGGTGTATVNVVSGTASLTNKNVLAPTVNTVNSISTLSVGENKNKKTID